MSAAGYAAQRGAEVIVIEKAADIGGSAAYTAGGLMRPRTAEDFITVNPGGDPAFTHALVADYDSAVEWISSLGVDVSDPDPEISATMGYPTSRRGHDVLAYLARCRSIVEGTSGKVLTASSVEKLLYEDGHVRGATVTSSDGTHVFGASWTLLATGGFQNNADLRARYLGSHAADMVVRSNPVSDGAGLRLGLSVGASTSDRMDLFYGHPVPWPLARPFGPADYVRLIQHFLSTHGVLLDEDGRRFVDESLGYYRNSQAVLTRRRGRALLVGDQRLRDRDGAGAPGTASMYAGLDRPNEARAAGANVAEAHTLNDLEQFVKPWGYAGIAAAVRTFNAELAADGPTDPPRRGNREPLAEAPYFAFEIQPAITNTWGGLRVDDHARVLDTDGKPIPGLLAAGGDIGGVYQEAYCGGLSMACVLGLRAARQALAMPT